MALLFWDASGLAKRYTAETGQATVNTVFNLAGTHRLATTPSGYAETCSILLRKLNGGILTAASWAKAVSALQVEVVDNPNFEMLAITEEDIFASILMMRRHNINSTDAAILTLLLGYVRTPAALTCLLIAVDKRLLRAAEAEGIATLDPEQVSATDVSARLDML